MITKTIQRSEDLYIQFSEEEMKQLSLKKGDKFSWKVENNAIILEKYVPIDIDISNFSRDVLEMLVIKSIEQDLPVNEVINDILSKQLAELNSNV